MSDHSEDDVLPAEGEGHTDVENQTPSAVNRDVRSLLIQRTGMAPRGLDTDLFPIPIPIPDTFPIAITNTIDITIPIPITFPIASPTL